MIYLGSKNRLAKDYWEVVKKNVPITEDTYFVDLFCGGCGMIKNVPLKNRIANDLSKPLIAYLRKLQEGTEWIPKDSCEFNLTRQKYEYIKHHKDEYKDYFLGYVGYTLSFNGSYFQGYMNPTEQLKDHVKRSYKTAVKDNKLIQGIQFYNRDYEDVPIPPKSIIFCDIPYKNTKGYDAVGSDFDYDRFFRYVSKLKDEGHYVFVCEYTDKVPENFMVVGEFKRANAMSVVGTNNLGKKHKKVA